MAGKDLMPYLNGKEEGPVHDVLYWRINHRWAIRDTEWKLVKNEIKEQPKLFQIAKDKTESVDLYEQHPEIAQKLRKKYQTWSKQVGAKQWGWSPSVGKHVRHPHEDFEGINTEQFLSHKNKGNLLYVRNPLPKGENTSDNVIGINPDVEGVKSLAVSMKTSVFQRRHRYLNVSVKADEPCDLYVEIKGKNGKAVRMEPINKFEAQGEWDKIDFDCQAFKGAVSQVTFVFQNASGTFTKPVYLDDIQFRSTKL